MADNIVNLPVPGAAPNADERNRADTDRQRRLFEWAEAVLHEQLGLTKAVAAAKSKEELLAVTFDANSAEVTLASDLVGLRSPPTWKKRSKRP